MKLSDFLSEEVNLHNHAAVLSHLAKGLVR